jgi:hypothetical protein
MSENIVAVEIRGWDKKYTNKLGDHRDLGTVGTPNANASTALAKGLDGRSDSATVVTDTAGSPQGFGFVDSQSVLVDSTDFFSLRVWVLKDSDSDQIGLRILVDGSALVAATLRTDTGALSFQTGVQSATTYTGSATERVVGGQTWWEVWIAGADSTLTGLNSEALVRIYPAIDSQAATRSVTIGGVELYGAGESDGLSESPVALANADLLGTPANHGDHFFATRSFTSEKTGDGGTYTFFPLLYPDEWPRLGPTNTLFQDRLASMGSYSVEVAPQFWSSRSSVGIGSIEINNDDGALDGLITHNWRDRFVIVKIHNTSNSYLRPLQDFLQADNPGAETALIAIVESFEVVNESRLRIVIRDPVPDLYRPLNQYYPAGSASPDPYINAHYRGAPITLGQPKQCVPVLTDSSTLTYELHDSSIPNSEGTGLSSVSEVYIAGQPQSTESPTYGSATAGFTLNSSPTGRVSADPVSTSAATISGIAGEITARRAGIVFDDISLTGMALTHSSPEIEYTYGAYIDNPTQPSAILNWITSSVGGFWYVNRFGEIVIGQLKEPVSLLENLLIRSAASPNNLDPNGNVGWVVAGSADSTLDKVGLDGTVSASAIEETEAAGNVPLTVADGLVAVTASTNPVCMRVWVLKDAVSSPDINIRVLGDGSAFTSFTLDTSTGAVVDSSSGSNSAHSVTERTVAGQQWWELTMQADSASYTVLRPRIYPAGTTPADTRSGTNSAVIGGVELYDNITVSDVHGTPPNIYLSKVIDDDNIIGEIGIAIDNAPNLSDFMGTDKNWSRATTGEGSGENGEKFAREYQTDYRSSSVPHNTYRHSTGAKAPMSLHVDSVAAQTEADRVAAIYQQQRYFYSVTISMRFGSFEQLIDSVGQVFSVSSDRFLLDEKLVTLVGVEGEFLKNEIKLKFWG